MNKWSSFGYSSQFNMFGCVYSCNARWKTLALSLYWFYMKFIVLLPADITFIRLFTFYYVCLLNITCSFCGIRNAISHLKRIRLISSMNLLLTLLSASTFGIAISEYITFYMYSMFVPTPYEIFNIF